MATQATAYDEPLCQNHGDCSRPSPNVLYPDAPPARFEFRFLQAIARRIPFMQDRLLASAASAGMPGFDGGRATGAPAWGGAEPCFARLPVSRPPADAHRIAYAGQLSPSSGAVDFLICAAAWAERNPDRCLELCWIGEGNLRGVLMAQPLPANLRQEFTGALAPVEMAERFGRTGLFVAPSLSRCWPPFLAIAMAAGLVVLGSSRNPSVRSLVAPGQTGWLFDPYSAKEMLDVLDAALVTSPVQLDAMRAAARARIGALQPEALAQVAPPGWQRAVAARTLA